MKKNPSYIASIAEKLVKVIDSSQIAKARRVYVPEIDALGVGDDPEVFIRPSVLEVPRRDVPHSRKTRFLDIPYELILISKVDGYDIADIDVVVALYEKLDQYIYQHVRVVNTDYGGSAFWLESSIDTTFNQESLRQYNLVQVTGQVVYRHQS